MNTIKYIIFLLLGFMSTGILEAQCPSGDISFFNQAEVEQFAIDYPNCTSLNGDLIIGYAEGINVTDINSLDSLHKIISIADNLIIRNNPDLYSLDGLNQLFSCQDINIVSNKNLKNLEGLNSIADLIGKFIISKNDSLTTLEGLDAINTIASDFQINENNSLTSLTGIESLTAISGSFDIYDNFKLQNMNGLDNLKNINSYFSIDNNETLVSLAGLNSLLIIEGVLYITNNDSLTMCSETSICNHIANSTEVIIGNNNTNCNSIEEISDICDATMCTTSLSSILLHTTCGMNNGSIHITNITGVEPFELLWNTGDTTSTLNNLDAGIYTLSILDGNDCVTIESYTIDSSLSISYIDTTISASCDNSNGSISITVIDGEAPYSINWESGEDSFELSELAGGTYSFTLTDALDCQIVDSITIYNTSLPSTNISSTNVTFINGSNGTATVHPSDGLPPYDVLWSTGDTTNTISSLAPGQYYVTVSDANNCEVSATVIIRPFSCYSFRVEYEAQGTSCIGSCDGALQLDISGGTQPYIIVWENRPDTTEELSDLCFGNYYYSVTDSNFCFKEGAIFIFQPSPINAEFNIVNESYIGLSDGSITLDTTIGGTAPYTYLWSTGDTLSNLDSLSPGDYFLTITDAHQCTANDSFTINEAICPYLTISDSIILDDCDPTICSGSIFIQDIDGGSSPYTFLWDNNDQTQNRENLCTGTYYVTITDNESCSYVKEYIIGEDIFNGEFELELLYETAPNASDAIATLAINDETQYQIRWSTQDTLGSIDSLSAGQYQYTITDQQSCSHIDSFDIPEFNCENFGIVTTKENVICFGEEDGVARFIGLTYAQGYDSLYWSNGSQDSTIIGLVAGTYKLNIVLDTFCILTDTVIIDQPREIIAHIDELVHLTDTTESKIVLIIDTVEQNHTISWEGPLGFTSNESVITDLIPGCYSVVITDTASNCQLIIDSLCIKDLTTGTIDTDSNISIRIYPNPVKDVLNLDLSDILSTRLRNGHMSLINEIGQTIFNHKKISNSIDMKSYEKGIYFLHIELDDRTKVYKVILL